MSVLLQTTAAPQYDKFISAYCETCLQSVFAIIIIIIIIDVFVFFQYKNCKKRANILPDLIMWRLFVFSFPVGCVANAHIFHFPISLAETKNKNANDKSLTGVIFFHQ